MKIPISVRLFGAVLVTALSVLAVGGTMLRIGVERSFARYVAEIEVSRLSGLATQLEAEYRAHGWPHLAPAQQGVWLREQFRVMFDTFLREQAARGDTPPLPEALMRKMPLPPPDRLALHERVGLEDAAGQLVAGVKASADAPRRTLTVAGRPVGALTLIPTVDPSDALARTFYSDQARNLVVMAVVCLVLSALAAALLAAHFRAPIVRLGDAARRLTAGRFDTRVAVQRSDELGELARSFNRLATILGNHESARRQWVADTSHELRTPVAVLRAQIEAIQDGVRRADAAQLAAMHGQVMLLSRLIDELYELARADVGHLHYAMAPLDPWALVQQEAEGFRSRLVQAGLSLQLEAPQTRTEIEADADRLRQVLANLLENCVRYTDAGGCVRVTAQLSSGFWSLVVDDSAPGVPDAALDRLSERFFRLETSRSRALGGSGLGLALCQRIAQAHGGDLQCSHSELGGLRVQVSFAQRA